MTTTNKPLSGRTICIMATNGFEQSELFEPLNQLRDAGATVHIASLDTDDIRAWDQSDWGKTITVDKKIAEIDCEDYDALVLPGGQINPDLLRVEERAVDLVRAFDHAKKPIAAICHAPWLLIEADLVKGKRLTSYKSIRTDMKNAGANVVDEQVAVDGHFITSRNPDDLDAFCAKIIEMVASREPALVAETA